MDRKLRILMVEDNPADADLNAEQLADAGLSFEYRRVENEPGYLKELTQFKPDVILADYRLPQFDGLTALRLAQERYPFIPFIIVSGVIEEESAVDLLRSGASDYVLKRNIVRLGPAVRNALEIKQAKEEKAHAEEALRASYAQLEQRVKDRTAELERLNDKLQQEIDERRKSEEALRASEKKYRLLIETANSIILQWDTNGAVTFMNDYGFSFFGYARDEIIGQDIMKLVKRRGSGGEDWSNLTDDIMAHPEQYVSHINENVCKNGETVWVYWNNRIIADESGKIAGVLAVGNDVTELKKAEDTLRRNEYELRTLVANSPDLIFRLNRQLQYVFANPAYERVTGIPRDRLIGRTNRELGMPLQLTEFWQSEVQGVMDSGRENSIEFEMAGFFGKRYFSSRLIPEFAKSGLVETVLVIARDITERKHAEERIRYISFHDEVTGLFNRAFFEEEIRRVDTERDLPVSIIMGDVNNLKLSNDVFGHDEGDTLLRAIAEIFRKACRQGDVIARWGGDEFAVILPKTEFVTADGICSRIGQIAKESEGTALQPSIAVGIAAKEQRGQNISRVIRQAEQNMYDNKLAHARENEAAVLSSLLSRVRDRVAGYGGHITRSHELGRRFVKELGSAEELVKDLDLLIEMHDIGKATIPEKILSKPGPLSYEEWDVMKKHPEAGFRIVKTFAGTANISDEVLSHVERWDGSGYPRGLKGKEIPYLSRVFLIIDAFDIMTHPRPYARTLTGKEAIEEIRRNAGKQFDPELADTFIARVLKKEEVAV